MVVIIYRCDFSVVVILEYDEGDEEDVDSDTGTANSVIDTIMMKKRNEKITRTFNVIRVKMRIPANRSAQ